MTFSEALVLMKKGAHLSRQGWNGRGMSISLSPGDGTHRDSIEMKPADGLLVPWIASQSDILADDWTVEV